jgi:hypothetical protein
MAGPSTGLGPTKRSTMGGVYGVHAAGTSPPGKDHTKTFRGIAAAIAALPARMPVLDGELCVFDETLVSHYHCVGCRAGGRSSRRPCTHRPVRREAQTPFENRGLRDLEAVRWRTYEAGWGPAIRHLAQVRRVLPSVAASLSLSPPPVPRSSSLAAWIRRRPMRLVGSAPSNRRRREH